MPNYFESCRFTYELRRLTEICMGAPDEYQERLMHAHQQIQQIWQILLRAQRTPTANARSEHPERTPTANTHSKHPQRTPTANTHSEHRQRTPTATDSAHIRTAALAREHTRRRPGSRAYAPPPCLASIRGPRPLRAGAALSGPRSEVRGPRSEVS